jgi:hypothetical protein
MKMKGMIQSILALCCVLPGGVHAQVPASGVIVPGEAVAGLKLGSTFSEFQAMFPRHPDIDEDAQNNLQNGCPERSYHWLDLDRNANGVYALFKSGKIYQMSVHTPRFALSDGVHIDSTTEEVKRAFPTGQEYVLVGSGSAVVGGKDLLYWVDKAHGVAFELYWNTRKRERLVSSIDIFAPGSEYLPSGCISTPQSWKPVK